MDLELKSPQDERAAVRVPASLSDLTKRFNGALSSAQGDEYPVRGNIIHLLQDDAPGVMLARSAMQWQINSILYGGLPDKIRVKRVYGGQYPVEEEKELLLAWMAPTAGKLYLDSGCSALHYALLLKEAEPRAAVAAVDISAPMLKNVRERAKQEQAQLFLICAEEHRLPFYSRTFDGIVKSRFLNSPDEEAELLHDLRRVLKDDGSVFVRHPLAAESFTGRMFQRAASIAGFTFWDRDELNNVIEQAGFEIAAQEVIAGVCFSKLGSKSRY